MSNWIDSWIGVDFDGTLCTYGGDIKYEKYRVTGEPIPAMVDRVKTWLKAGIKVKIFTARAFHQDPIINDMIQDWCEKHIGERLEVTCVKDFAMIELWDDRAVGVEKNTGRIKTEF